MRARITVLAAVVLSGNPIAAPADYAVDGLAVGTQLNFGSALYREYKCSPSDQFDGLTWCQKRRGIAPVAVELGREALPTLSR